jgi:hypothetical protein
VCGGIYFVEWGADTRVNLNEKRDCSTNSPFGKSTFQFALQGIDPGLDSVRDFLCFSAEFSVQSFMVTKQILEEEQFVQLLLRGFAVLA